MSGEKPIVLEKYQKEGVKFLLANPKCILSDETGLGKTYQGIQAIKERGLRALVVAPKKLCDKWSTAISKFGLKACKLYERTPEADDDVVIANYASVKKFQDEIVKQKLQVAVLEEAHYLQNRNSARTKAVKKITKGYPYIWMLTATPIWDKLDTAWSLLNILDRKTFSSYWSFVNKYCVVVKSPFGTDVKGTQPGMVEEAQKLLKKYILVRRKADELDLPEMIQEEIILDVDKRLIKENRHLRRSIKDETGFANKARLKIHLMDRNVFNFEQNERLFSDVWEPAKKKALYDVLAKEAGKKILVLVRYAECAHIVHTWLQEAGVHVNPTPITGEVCLSDRELYIKEFSEYNGTSCLVGTCRTLGTGLDLHCASVMIFMEHPDLYAELIQNLGRVARYGTTESQFVYHIMQKGTLDIRDFKRCMSGAAESEAIMDGL